MIERRKLHTNNAATDDDDGFRQFSRSECVRRIPDSRIVLDTRNRRHKIRRTRTNHQILRLILCFVTRDDEPFTLPFREGTGVGYPIDHRAMFVIQPLLDTRNEFTYNDGLAFLHGAKIKRHVLCRYTVFLRVGGIKILLRAVEKRFGRNTSHIETRASERGLLKEHHIFACLRGFFSSCIARRAAADDCKKIFHILFFIRISGVLCNTMLLAGTSWVSQIFPPTTVS